MLPPVMKNTVSVPALLLGAWIVGSVSCTFAQPVPPSAPSVASPAVPSGPAPKIAFSSLVHDFGRVSAGEIVRANFTFTNTGNAALEITEVVPTCGCTTAGTWEKRIEPGKTGTIPLQVNTANFSGPVTKFVTVRCTDPTQNTVMLQVKGTIWKPIDVTPMFVVFNISGDPPTNEVRSVKISNNTDQALVLSDLQTGNRAFTAEIKTNQPGKEFEIQIRVVPPLAIGTIQGPVTVKTSSTNMPVISITAMAMVQPPLVAVPGQVFLQPGPLPTQTQVALSIRNNASAPVSLSSPSVSVENVQAQVQENQTGRLFSVTLTFPQGFLLPSGQNAEFTLKTSHPSQPQLKVPIVQIPRPPAMATAPAPPPLIAAPPAPPPLIAAPAQPALQRVPTPPPPLPPGVALPAAPRQ